MEKHQIVLEGFKFAKDFVTQLISLSTGILALSLSFKDRLVGSIGERFSIYLRLSWAGYLISILFGIITLMSIIGQLTKGSLEMHEGLLIFQGAQIITFLLSTLLIIFFGMQSLKAIFKNKKSRLPKVLPERRAR